MTTPLISVIVPIYNVERYLRRCLDSLKGQTLKEIEVIMIDDGSSDKSREIAEEYCSDPRFRCIHTENHGVSAARNRGIDEATAKWLMFVDSDDWVDEKYCEIPYMAALENEADMVIFRTYHVKRGKIQEAIEYSSAPNKQRIISSAQAVDIGNLAPWNKLYRRDLFQGICFPDGKIFEDIATTHKLEYAAKRIVFLSDRLYYYVLRRRSISHNYTASSNADHFIAYLQRYEDLVAYGYPESKAVVSKQSAAIRHLMRTAPCEDELYLKAMDIAESIDGIPKGLNKKQKAAFTVWQTNRKLFYLIAWVVRRLKI